MNTEKLKELALAATPGPWRTAPASGELLAKINTGYAALLCCDYCNGSVRGNLANRDVEYISAANPAAILELIAERDALRAQLDELQEWVDLIRRHKGDQYLIINRHNDYPYHEGEFDYRFFTKQEVAEALKYISPGQARVVEIGRVLSEKEIVALCEQKGVDS